MPDMKLLSNLGNAPGALVGYSSTARRGGAEARRNVFSEVWQYLRSRCRRAVTADARIVRAGPRAQAYYLWTQKGELAPLRLDALAKVRDVRQVPARIMQLPAPAEAPAPAAALPLFEAQAPAEQAPVLSTAQRADELVQSLAVLHQRVLNDRPERIEINRLILQALRTLKDPELADFLGVERQRALLVQCTHSLLTLHFPEVMETLGVGPAWQDAMSSDAMPAAAAEARLERLISALVGEARFVTAMGLRAQAAPAVLLDVPEDESRPEALFHSVYDSLEALQAANDGDASGAALFQSALDKPGYGHYRLEDKKDFLARRYAHSEGDWPSPVLTEHQSAFLAQLGGDLAALCQSTPELDARLLDVLMEASRLSTLPAGQSPNVSPTLGQGLDALHALRLHLADLSHLDFERGGLASVAEDGSRSDPVARLAQLQVQGGDADTLAQRRQSYERVKRFEAHGQAVDRLLGPHHSLAPQALALKLSVARDDADRRLVTLLHERQLSLQTLHKTLRIEQKVAGRQATETTSALVSGSVPRFDGRLRALLFSPRAVDQGLGRGANWGSRLGASQHQAPWLADFREGALIKGSGAVNRTRVKASNAHEFKLLLAHTLRLQQEIDQASGILEGEVLAEDRKQLMGAQDWSALGFSEDEIVALQSDAALAQALTQAEQLFQVGFDSPQGAERAAQQLNAIRSQVMKNELALQGLQAMKGTPHLQAKRLLQRFEAKQDSHRKALGQAFSPSSPEEATRLDQVWQKSAELGRLRHEVDQEATEAQAAIREINLARAPQGIWARLRARLPGGKPLHVDPHSHRTHEFASNLRDFERLLAPLASLPAPGQPSLAAAIQAQPTLHEGLMRHFSALAAQSGSALGRLLDADLQPQPAHWPSTYGGRESAMLALAGKLLSGQSLDVLTQSRHVLTLSEAPTRAMVLDRDLQFAQAQWQTLLAARRERMGPEMAQALTMGLQAAATQVWLAQSEAGRREGLPPQVGLVLVEHQDVMLEHLSALGITAERFGPEINDFLARQVDAAVVQRWHDESLATPLEDGGAVLASVVEGATHPADATLLTNTVAGMGVGDRVYLKCGRNLQFGVNKVPLEVTGTFRVSMTFSAGVSRQFDIKRKKDDLYQVTLLDGQAFGSTLGGSAKALKLADLSANAQFGHEASGGQVLEFGNLAAVQTFVQALLSEAPLTPRALVGAAHVRGVQVEETKIGADAGVMVGAKELASLIAPNNPSLAQSLAPGLEHDLGGGVKLAAGISLSGSAKATWSHTWSGTEERSNKTLVTKRSQAFAQRVDAELALKLRLPNVGDAAGQFLVNGTDESNPFAAPPVSALSVAPVAVYAKGYDREFAFERDPVHGTLLSIDQKYVLPLAPKTTFEAVAKGIPALRPHWATLGPGRQAEVEEALAKVDSPEGYVLLALLGGKGERVAQLNQAFESDKAVAEANRGLLGDRRAEGMLVQAYQQHANRIGQVDEEADAFELKALVLVRAANMTAERSWGLGVNRWAWSGKGGADSALAFIPAKPALPIAVPAGEAEPPN